MRSPLVSKVELSRRADSSGKISSLSPGLAKIILPSPRFNTCADGVSPLLTKARDLLEYLASFDASTIALPILVISSSLRGL